MDAEMTDTQENIDMEAQKIVENKEAISTENSEEDFMGEVESEEASDDEDIVDNVNNEQAANEKEQTNNQTTDSEYTLEVIAAHKTSTDCWSAIHGNVYDLTAWINAHPGGAEAIISLCGIDGTEAFNKKHGKSSKAKSMLSSLKI